MDILKTIPPGIFSTDPAILQNTLALHPEIKRNPAGEAGLGRDFILPKASDWCCGTNDHASANDETFVLVRNI